MDVDIVERSTTEHKYPVAVHRQAVLRSDGTLLKGEVGAGAPFHEGGHLRYPANCPAVAVCGGIQLQEGLTLGVLAGSTAVIKPICRLQQQQAQASGQPEGALNEPHSYSNEAAPCETPIYGACTAAGRAEKLPKATPSLLPHRVQTRNSKAMFVHSPNSKVCTPMCARSTA